MKRLVLPLLLLVFLSIGGIEYPEVIETYLSEAHLEDQEQHDRIERALLYLDGMEKRDIEVIALYLHMLLNVPDDECDCTCDGCCDDLVEEEFARS